MPLSRPLSQLQRRLAVLHDQQPVQIVSEQGPNWWEPRRFWNLLAEQPASLLLHLRCFGIEARQPFRLFSSTLCLLVAHERFERVHLRCDAGSVQDELGDATVEHIEIEALVSCLEEGNDALHLLLVNRGTCGRAMGPTAGQRLPLLRIYNIYIVSSAEV